MMIMNKDFSNRPITEEKEKVENTDDTEIGWEVLTSTFQAYLSTIRWLNTSLQYDWKMVSSKIWKSYM